MPGEHAYPHFHRDATRRSDFEHPRPAYFALAAPIELVEGMTQKGKANAALSPGTAHTQRTYPAQVRIIIGMRAAEIDTGDLVAIHGEEHKVGSKPS